MQSLNRHFLFSLCIVGSIFSLVGQQRQTGLLWQITGNGLTKPSYFYGTMHVSDKVAFHLGDQFFKALQSSDIVPLEQNLDSVYGYWLATGTGMIENGHGSNVLIHETFQQNEYDRKELAPVIMQGPLISNAVLYRINRLQLEFQEETYLDMLIYRLAKKYKKQFAGVEDYLEAVKLTTLAQAKEVRRQGTIGRISNDAYSDFYREGDLTSIDSLNKVLFSDNYLKHMLFLRNINMVNTFQNLSKNGSVFCGVGCAHLPGKDGILQLLMNLGYKVTPIKSLSLKPSKYLEKSKKIQVVTPLSTRTSADHFFTADLPGNIHAIRQENVNQTMYISLDIPAGGQYLVYRYQDFPSLRGKTQEDVLKSIDSFLYEIVLGTIDNLTPVSGDPALGSNSRGYDIRFTRITGDKGRYKLIHTGSEIVLIAVTGNKGFAEGKEANAFFNTFRLNQAGGSTMTEITSPDGIFTFKAPAASAAPVTLGAMDPQHADFNYSRTQGDYGFIASGRSLFNSVRLRPDTTELLLACESFAHSHKLLELKHYYSSVSGYPARYAVMKSREGRKYAVRVIIRGYKYLLQAVSGADHFDFDFFKELKINRPEITGTEFTVSDTFCHFSAKVKQGISRGRLSMDHELIREASFALENKQFGAISRQVWFSPDNDRDFLEVNYEKYSRYQSYKDSAEFWNRFLTDIGRTRLYVVKKEFKHGPDGTNLRVELGDTGCSRRIDVSYYIHGDEFVSALAFFDTITGQSEYSKRFLSTFKPQLTSNTNIFESKVPLWVSDINSADSTLRRKAWDGFDNLEVDSLNAHWLVKVYDTMSTGSQLVERKRSLIFKIGQSGAQRMIPVLARMYRQAGDTSAFQTAVIGALGYLKSKASYAMAKTLFFEETPMPDARFSFKLSRSINDSLELAPVMFPDLFNLMNITEYKDDIIMFAAQLTDSGFLKSSVYSGKVDVLVSEANIRVKKILSYEASKKDTDEEESDYEDLRNYLTLLLPYHKDARVTPFLEKVKSVKNRGMKLQFHVAMLKQGYSVEDSVFNNLAGEKKYKTTLYTQLEKIGKTDKFPAHLRSAAAIASAAYYDENNSKYINGTSTEIDSLQVADSLFVKFWNLEKETMDSGLVYLLKYNRKQKKDSDDDDENKDKDKDHDIIVNTQYYYAVAGPQPAGAKPLAKDQVLQSSNELAVKPEYNQKDEFLRLVKQSQVLQIAPGFYGYNYNWSYR